MVKNVRPGALAGNLTPLDPADGEVSQDVTADGDADALQLPDGDLDSRIAWVAEAEDQDEARERADVVWKAYEYDGSLNPGEVSGRLREAVFGSSDSLGLDPDANGPGIPSTTEVGSPTIGEPIEGQEAQTDGEGEAVNAETGEVTQPGEPLPEVEQAEGDPLPPADGDDSTETAPESTDAENAPETDAQNSTGSDDGGNAAD